MEESGDLIFYNECDNSLYFAVIDALGHGKIAYATAKAAVDYLEEKNTADPAADIQGLHQRLYHTRGAVVGLCNINKKTGELITCGVGNITAKILGYDTRKIVYRDGIVGFSMPSLKNQTMKVFPGDIIVLYSDGIKENFDMLEIPDLAKKTSGNIASLLIDRYSKNSDDASILALKVDYD